MIYRPPVPLLRRRSVRERGTSGSGDNLYYTAPPSLTVQYGLQCAIFPNPGMVWDMVKERSIAAGQHALLQYKRTPTGVQGITRAAGGAPTLLSNAVTADLNIAKGAVGVSGDYSLWLWAHCAAVSNNNTDYTDVISRAVYVSESNNQGWTFIKTPTVHASNGTPRMSFRQYRNTASADYDMKDTSTTLTAGTTYQWVGALALDPSGLGPGNRQLWTNGVNVFNNVGRAGGGTEAPSSGLTIDGISGLANDFVVLGFAFWKRTLTQNEILFLQAYPETLLEPLRGWRHLAVGPIEWQGAFASDDDVDWEFGGFSDERRFELVDNNLWQLTGESAARVFSIADTHSLSFTGQGPAQFTIEDAHTLSFAPGASRGFTLDDRETWRFFGKGGQQTTCVTGDGTPDGRGPEDGNYTF